MTSQLILTKAVFIGGERDREEINLSSELMCMTKSGSYAGVNYQIFIGEVKYVFTLFIYEGISKEIIEEKCKEISDSLISSLKEKE